MSTALEKHPQGALAVAADQTEWTPNQRAALVQLGVERASDADLMVFLSYSQRTGLDPFAKQIYMIQRKGKWAIQTGIDGMRVVAQRSRGYRGQTPTEWCGLDGVWHDVWLDPSTHPAAARQGVYREGFETPLYAVARWESYAVEGDGGHMWRKMPDVMIAKVAEALALRKAFPHDLSGIYTDDEMAQADDRPVDQRLAEATARSRAQALADQAGQHPGDKPALTAIWNEAKAAGVLGATVHQDGQEGPLHALIAELGTRPTPTADEAAATAEGAGPVVQGETVDAATDDAATGQGDEVIDPEADIEEAVLVDTTTGEILDPEDPWGTPPPPGSPEAAAAAARRKAAKA